MERHWVCLAWLAIFIGTAMRFYVAWQVQYIQMRDAAVPMVMAKHLSEGLPATTFYYGQPYMGSLEPMISAVFVWIFGPTAYANCAGTTLLGSLLLVFIYLIARDAAGVRAGFFAVAASIITSDAMFYYSTHPRGGYMTLMTLGMLTVFHANRFAVKALRDKSTSVRDLVLAGLYGGLGWWNNQMIVVFFAAAGLVVLPAIAACFKRGAWLLALAAFFTGSLPWWWWNLNNDWATFSFSSSFGQVTFQSGMSAFFRTFPDMMGYLPLDNFLNIFRLGAWLIAAMLALMALLHTGKREGWRSISFIALASAFLIIIAMALFYSQSHFSRIRTPRYVIPVVPAAAILVGVAADLLWRNRFQFARWTGILLFIMTIPGANYLHPSAIAHQAELHKNWESANELAAFLHEKGEGVAEGDFLYYWVNAATKEQAVIVNAPNDAYAPYNRLAAFTPRQIFINNFNGIREHLAATKADWQENHVAGFHVIHDVHPPSSDWNYIPRDAITHVIDTNTGGDVAGLLADENLETEYKAIVSPQNPRTIEWQLSEARPLNGLLVLNPRYTGLRQWMISGKQTDGAWVDVDSGSAISGYFWSGSRIYHRGYDYLQEVRFNSPENGFTAIRLVATSATTNELVLPEIVLLEKEPERPPLPAWETVDTWVDQLNRLQVDRLYAPRGISERLHGKLDERIKLRSSFYLDRTVHQLGRHDDPTAPYLDVAGRTALLVDPRDAGRTRRLLTTQTLDWREETIGELNLFLIEHIDQSDSLEDIVPLFWTDRGLFAGSGRHDRIRRADKLYDKSVSENDAFRKQRLLEACLDLAPEHEAAQMTYRQIAGTGDNNLPGLKNVYHPEIEAGGKFPNGLTFAGITVNPSSSGDRALDISYFWRLDPRAGIHRWSVFVHFRLDGKIVFQDDHNLPDYLTREDVANQPFPRLFKVTRTIPIPPGLRGEIELNLGLVNPATGDRARVRSEHELRRKTVTIPAAFSLP